MSDIFLFLQNGWKNIWKEKLLWLFSALFILNALISFIPIHNNAGLLMNLLGIAKAFTSWFLITISSLGLTYIAYCTINGIPVNIQTTFLVIRKFFWKVFYASIVILFFLAPFICLVLIFSFSSNKQLFPIMLAHNFRIVIIPLSVFGTISFFLTAEIITSESSIWKSLKTVWVVFTKHFAVLAFIGIILTVAGYAIDITIGSAIILFQHKFDLAVLSKLDFIAPYLSFTNQNPYTLAEAITQSVWRPYNTSVFILAYVKYRNIQTKK